MLEGPNIESQEDITEGIQDPFGDVPLATIEEDLAANPQILESIIEAQQGPE